MANLFEETKDIEFLTKHFINWNDIVPLIEKDFADAKTYKDTQDANFEFAPTNTAEAADSYQDVYSAYGQIISEQLLPHVLKIDTDGLDLKDGKVTFPQEMTDFFDTLRESGLLSYSHQRKYGGYNLGIAARMPINEMVYGADVGTGIILGYYNMAEVIEFFGDEDMKAKYLPRFGAGEMIGAMALTEPNFGSDLSNIGTKATNNGDGTFKITGTKRFITQACGFGEHPAAIFTIARSKDAKGAKGISFFLVETDQISVEKLEEKIGLHGSATCEIVYDNATGYLIGEEGKGLVKYAIALMNGARVGIACQSLGTAQRALTLGKHYANQREQFGALIKELPAVARLLDESEARTQAARSVVYRTAEIVDMLQGMSAKKEAEGVDEKALRRDPDVMKWDKLAKIMTPTSKLCASEFAIRVAYDCLQVHGGVGYTEEFEIAKIYRDARISTIYEGTSQLQTVAIIGGVVEGVGENSITYKYVQDELAKVGDAALKKQIEKHWASLKQSVAIYKEFDKETRARVAWDICWHWVYVITQILLGQHLAVATDKNLADVVESKGQVVSDYMLIADREVAACVQQIENYKAKALQPA